MRRVLVVSDNPELATCFRAAFEAQRLGEVARVDYRYSAVNRSPAAMVALGAAPIDMKGAGTAQAIAEGYDCVFSIHCKQIFPRQVVERVTCINVHPGLNPHNRGWYPQVFSILNGLPAGATIHLMDAEVDHGAIVAQRPVEVGPADTSLDVYRRVVEAEKALLREHLGALVAGTFQAAPAGSEGNYNSIQDFKRRCQLDLDAVGTLRQHLDLLRALSHGEFRNAWFAGPDGRKVYVRVCLEREGAPPNGPG